MSRALTAELLKLRTTRTAFGFLAAALLLTALFLTVGIITSTLRTADDSAGSVDVSLAPLLALIAAIVAVTGEYRHGTIAATFIAVPVRRQQLAAQALAWALAGAGLGLATWTLQIVLGVPLLSSQSAPGLPFGDVLSTAAREILAAALLAALGVGVGALVRHQAGALVGALVTGLFLEPTLGALVDATSGYGPFGAAAALIGMGDVGDPSELTGGLVLAAWTAAALAAGLLATERRDV